MPKSYKKLEDLEKDKERAKQEKIDKELAEMAAMGFDVSTYKPEPELADDTKLNRGGFNWYKIDPYPSNGQWYEPGTKFYGKPLTLLDLRLLATMQEYNADSITRAVISRNVYSPQMQDLEELLIQDRMFFIFWLRQQTFANSNYEMSYRCPDCDTRNPIVIEIPTMEIIPAPKEYEDTLTVGTGEVLKISPTKDKDNKFIEQLLETNDPDKSGMDEYMIRAFAIVRSINDEPCNIAQVKNIMSKNPGDFGPLLRLGLKINDWGPLMLFKGKCAKCGRLTNVSITFPPDFYIPGFIK